MHVPAQDLTPHDLGGRKCHKTNWMPAILGGITR
jgi:hypothetical protein